MTILFLRNWEIDLTVHIIYCVITTSDYTRGKKKTTKHDYKIIEERRKKKENSVCTSEGKF